MFIHGIFGNLWDSCLCLVDFFLVVLMNLPRLIVECNMKSRRDSSLCCLFLQHILMIQREVGQEQSIDSSRWFIPATCFNDTTRSREEKSIDSFHWVVLFLTL